LKALIARVEDAMQSAQLAIRRLMADLKSADEARTSSNQPVGVQFRARDGTSYEVKRGDNQTGTL
jgi:hypothetical protein